MAELPVRQPDWIDDAPIRNAATRRIAAKPDAVWARIADHEAWPEWFTVLKSVRVTTGAEGVGGGRAVSMPGATMHEVFTVWEPSTHFAFAVVKANPLLASMAESVELTPDGDGCVIRYRQGIEPARGFGWFWKATLPRLRRELVRALDRLAVLAEAS
jgi:carbon monoxide dehydrogenase subunit G